MSAPKEPIIPYGRQTVTEEDIAAVTDILRGPYLTQGPAVPAFEQAVANKVGAKHGVAVNSATSALHIACIALGLEEGDHLWTSPITFVASANCGRYCGAKVDFVDVNPSTGLMSIDSLKNKLAIARANNCLPKILVPVHLCGTSCDMQAIADLAERYDFRVIEDASHAVGGLYQNEPVGNCRYSDISVFSFHPVKIITTGEGGLATTNDAHLAERMSILRSHGITKDHDQFERRAAGPWSYEQQRLGFNYRMTDMQAALGLNQLKRLDEIVAERNRQLRTYKRLFAGLPVRLLDVPEDVQSSVHLAVICLESASTDQHRKVFESMRSLGIGVQLHYTPVHLQPFYRQMGFGEGQFPMAESYASSAISLPLFPGLGQLEQARVKSALVHSLNKQELM